MEENGITFIRFDNMQVHSTGWMGLEYVSASNAVDARYIAIKLRIGENGAGQKTLKIFTGTHPALESEGQSVTMKVVENGEWAVIVFDVAATIQNPGKYMVPNADGSYTINYFSIRPFSHHQSDRIDSDGDGVLDKYVTYPSSEAYMDIAYIAFFEDMSQLSEFVDTETYEWSTSSTVSTLRYTSDNSCVAHTLAAGGNNTYVCPGCGKTIVAREIPDSVKAFYDADHIILKGDGTLANGPHKYQVGGVAAGQNGNAGTLIYEGGDVGARITGNQVSSVGQIIWQRNNADSSNYHASSQQHYTRDLGQARYLVIKAKTSNTALALSLNISTTAHTGAGYVTVALNATEAGEWGVYVVDLAALVPAYAADGELGTYITDTFFFNINAFSAEDHVDIAYMAFVEGDWSDIDALVLEDVAYNVTSATEKTFTKVSVADGSEITE